MASRNKSRFRPGLKWYLFALLMIAGGILAPVLPGGYRYWQPPLASRFPVPGGREVSITKRGGYTIWYDHLTTFNGRQFDSSTNLPPGLAVVMTHKITGTNIPMTPDTSAQAVGVSSDGISARRSVARFKIVAPGQYVVASNARIEEPVVFSLREDWLFETVNLTVICIIIGFVAVIVGLVMIPVVFILRLIA